MFGALWAIAAALAWTLGNIAVARGLQRVGVVRGTLVQLVVSTTCVGATTLAVEGSHPFRSTSALPVAYFAASGLLHFLAGWGFMNASIRRIGPSRMSAVTNGVAPLLAVLLAVVTLGEHLTPLVGAGAVLIVAGTYLVTVS
jgi:drug/metabolite transporter (DMT)-like permease